MQIYCMYSNQHMLAVMKAAYNMLLLAKTVIVYFNKAISLGLFTEYLKAFPECQNKFICKVALLITSNR